jgi:hypothetical protein
VCHCLPFLAHWTWLSNRLIYHEMLFKKTSLLRADVSSTSDYSLIQHPKCHLIWLNIFFVKGLVVYVVWTRSMNSFQFVHENENKFFLVRTMRNYFLYLASYSSKATASCVELTWHHAWRTQLRTGFECRHIFPSKNQ